MRRKTVSGIMLSLLLIGMLILAFNIQPVKSDWTWTETIYIRADGSVYPDTAPISSDDNITYTLTDNIVGDIPKYYRAIVVERDNIVVDGAGYTLQGIGAEYSQGVSLAEISNVTLKNVEIKAFYYCVYLKDSSSNTISGNNITNNNRGIYLEGSSNNNVITGNNITNNGWGIHLKEYPNNNVIVGNNITNNNRGIYLDGSSNNTLRNNDASENKYNFGVFSTGGTISYYIQDIDDSNTVDGKPIYYWVNRRDITVPLDAGYLGLVNCTRMTVKNLNLTNNGEGLLLAYTTNSTITKNNITNNLNGIFMSCSNGNLISNNEISNNKNEGIALYRECCRNIISCNSITRNQDSGINPFSGSDSNIIVNNTVTSNAFGIAPFGSNNNSIIENIVSSNVKHGFFLAQSDNNKIIGNIIMNNSERGICLAINSRHQIIRDNTLSENYYGIYISYSDENTIYHNTFINNTYQVAVGAGDVNTWDNGYPSGGNYWSDYAAVDVKSGPNQDQLSSDGIGDTAYDIDENNRDHYPLMYTGPFHQLTVTSSPTTGIQFTINGAPKTTPYTEWLLEGSYTLEMPMTHNRYIWSHWLEDGDPNRIKTILLQGTTWTAVYEPKPVGGKAAPINIPMNKPETPTLWIWLTTIILSLAVTSVYVKKRKRNTRTLP